MNLFFNPIYGAHCLKISPRFFYKIIVRHIFSAFITRGCLLVLHRIRNNLMHGMKLLEGLDGQIELFRAATAVLESIAG